jgi:hypothetical protein
MSSQLAERHHELRPPLGRDLEAGSPGVSAMPDEERGATFERRAEVEAAVAPAGRPDDIAELSADHGRPPEVVDEPRGDEADDPDRPRTADDRRGRRAGHRTGGCRRLDGGPCLGHHLAGEVAAALVGGLELDSQPIGLGAVVGQQQL